MLDFQPSKMGRFSSRIIGRGSSVFYGFPVPFERAFGVDHIRTQSLKRDLARRGVDAAAFHRIHLCADIPGYGCRERRPGAPYAIEGSALGGRLLCRGLDRFVGADMIEGCRIFAGWVPGQATLGSVFSIGLLQWAPIQCTGRLCSAPRSRFSRPGSVAGMRI